MAVGSDLSPVLSVDCVGIRGKPALSKEGKLCHICIKKKTKGICKNNSYVGRLVFCQIFKSFERYPYVMRTRFISFSN